MREQWSPRSPLRWGDQQLIVQGPTIGATIIQTRELVRAEGPAPATWNLAGTWTGLNAADIPAATGELVLRCGCGAASSELALPFTLVANSILFAVAMLPAEWLTARVRYTGAVAVGGNWLFQLWAAPAVQWEGVRVEA